MDRACRWAPPAGACVYRKSWVKEAGFDEVPDRPRRLPRALPASSRRTGTRPGLALGNAVGDGNAWCHWVVWAHGGAMVDENDQVVINSPETVEALKYAKALYETFIPGTLSWLDPSNNKAFLAGEIGLTQNGISVYYAAKNSEDAAVKEMAEDIYHARMPVGPVGRADRAGPDRQRDGVRLHRVPERCQGIHALHDGGGAVRRPT